MRKELT